MQLNELRVIGNLTRDPEIRTVGNGISIANLNIAINRTTKVKEEIKKEVVFMKVTIWGKKADECMNLQKGKAVLVFGRLKQNEWQDKEGKKVISIEIHADNVIPIERED
ncbi:MAG: single-stranded DNA-binding protein [Patescibacteria group bacterium]